ncbi:aspartate aminotransferase, mitochondrial-like [Euphorbia lathyris]|uniref:aspartate aminotransferase, mitochondrial-like n=1 Tax=Euphorbia lathyris TaxID=212925 RepID=UPI0033144EE8
MWRNHLMRTSRCLFSTSNTAHRWWDHVGLAPKDPITTVTHAFLADPFPSKINLGVGAYRDDEGKPLKLQCVREAEAKIAHSQFSESISSVVSSKLIEESVKLVYGKDSDIIREGKFAGVEALSGTGACRLFAEFQRRFFPQSRIYLPHPTWSNHHNIWRDAQIPIRSFRYYDSNLKSLNFTALMEDVKNAPDGSFFLLHPCAHNPTGVDPTEEQWREISHQFKVKNHFPFFDMAYQGFASGDLDRDAQSIRIFLEDGHLIGCAQSFAKNMGLYGHRVGCLSVVCNDMEQSVAIRSQLEKIGRAMYSSPPAHGILLVSTILSDPPIKELWIKEVKGMADRIRRMRTHLQESLYQSGSSLNWEHITKQVGMFCFSGLTAEQVVQLARQFHVYMTADGRISMAGVTLGNVNYIANSIHHVTKFDHNVYSIQQSSSACL